MEKEKLGYGNRNQHNSHTNIHSGRIQTAQLHILLPSVSQAVKDRQD